MLAIDEDEIKVELSQNCCKTNIARARELMAAPMPEVDPPAAHDTADPQASLETLEDSRNGQVITSPCRRSAERLTGESWAELRLPSRR